MATKDIGEEDDFEIKNSACAQFLKLYGDWANHHLQKLVPGDPHSITSAGTRFITNLTSDVRDGVVLADVIEAVVNTRHSLASSPLALIGKFTPVHSPKVENIARCLHVLRQLGVNVDGIRATDIASGNFRSILIVFFGLSRYERRRKEQRHLTTDIDSQSSGSSGSINQVTWSNSDVDDEMKRHQYQRSAFVADVIRTNGKQSDPLATTMTSAMTTLNSSRAAIVAKTQKTTSGQQFVSSPRGVAGVRVTQLQLLDEYASRPTGGSSLSRVSTVELDDCVRRQTTSGHDCYPTGVVRNLQQPQPRQTATGSRLTHPSAQNALSVDVFSSPRARRPSHSVATLGDYMRSVATVDRPQQMDSTTNVIMTPRRHGTSITSGSRIALPVSTSSAYAHIRPVAVSRTTSSHDTEQSRRSTKSGRQRTENRHQRRRSDETQPEIPEKALAIGVRPSSADDGSSRSTVADTFVNQSDRSDSCDDDRRVEHLDMSCSDVAYVPDNENGALVTETGDDRCASNVIRPSGIMPPSRLRGKASKGSSAQSSTDSLLAATGSTGEIPRCVDRSTSLPPTLENQDGQGHCRSVDVIKRARAVSATIVRPSDLPGVTPPASVELEQDSGTDVFRCSKAVVTSSTSKNVSSLPSNVELSSVSVFSEPYSTPLPHTDHISSLRRKRIDDVETAASPATLEPLESDESRGGVVDTEDSEQFKTDLINGVDSTTAAALLEETDSFDVEPMRPMSFGIAGLVRQHSWTSSVAPVPSLRSPRSGPSSGQYVGRVSSRSAQSSPVVELPTSAHFGSYRRDSFAELPSGSHSSFDDYYSVGLTGSLDGQFRRRSAESARRSSTDNSSSMTSPDIVGRKPWPRRSLSAVCGGPTADNDIGNYDDVSSGYVSIGNEVAGDSTLTCHQRRQLPQQPVAGCAPWQAMQRRFDEGLRAAREFIASSDRPDDSFDESFNTSLIEDRQSAGLYSSVGVSGLSRSAIFASDQIRKSTTPPHLSTFLPLPAVKQLSESFEFRPATPADFSSVFSGNAYEITGSERVDSSSLDRTTLPRTGKQRRLPTTVGVPSLTGCTAYELNGNKYCNNSGNVTNEELIQAYSLAMTSHPVQPPLRQNSLAPGGTERSPSSRSTAQLRSSSSLSVNHSSSIAGGSCSSSTGRTLPPHPGCHAESSTARSDFYQTRRPDDAPCYRPTSSTTSSTVSVWNDFPSTPTRFPVNEPSSRPPTGNGVGHVAAIRLGVDSTSFGASRSFVSSPSVRHPGPQTGNHTPYNIDGYSEESTRREQSFHNETCVVITNQNAGSPATGHYQVPVSAYSLNGSSIPEESYGARGGTGNRSSSHHITSGSATGVRHRSGSNAGVGSGLYSGSLPRLGPRSPASNGNVSGAAGTGFSTSASMPVSGAAGTGAASGSGTVGGCNGGGTGGGGNWWTMKSNGAGCRDSSDGSSSSNVITGNSLTPPRQSASKDDDIHGSVLSLISNTSSVFSTPEEKQSQEVRKLKRELESAHEKIGTLTAQLSANSHVVAAFEQSLSNMTQRMQKLTMASDRKDCELNDLRTTVQQLQRLSQDHFIANGFSSADGGSERMETSSDSELSLSSSHSPSISNGAIGMSRLSTTSSSSDAQHLQHRSKQQQHQQRHHIQHGLTLHSGVTAAELNKKRSNWISSSFRKAFSRRKSKRQNSLEVDSDITFHAACDDSLFAANSMPSSPLMTACISNRHASTPSTPQGAPRRRSSAVLPPTASAFDSLVVDIDVTDPEQLVLRLSEQLHEKDMKLTDVRLEALSSAHQLEQLRETLNKMKIEMLQMKAENERMQRTIAHNGLNEIHSSPTEDDANSFKKKLSIGDPTTFDAIALESGNKDGQVFNVCIQLRSEMEKSKDEQDGVTSPRVFPVGTLSMTSRTQWTTLDETVCKVFKSYLSRLDPSTILGLSEDSMADYRVGDITRIKGSSPPELLPCGYLVGDNRDVIVSLRGPEESCVDELAFDTLIPKPMMERYVSLLVEHRRLILCGPSGTGKTFLARKLAEHLVHLTGRQSDTAAIETFNVDQKSGREVRHYLSNIAELCSVATSGDSPTPPVVIVVDNLHHVTSLVDTFSSFFEDGIDDGQTRPYVIGTMRSSSATAGVGPSSTSSTTTDVQLAHHNFRWVLLTNHSEPVRGLLSRYLQRRLVGEELTRRTSSSVSAGTQVIGEQIARVVAWLPKVWGHVNRFLEVNCSPDVTLGPRLFLKCPMDEVNSRIWFTDLWNYSIVPYLLEALREVKQQGQGRQAIQQWEDPTDWVMSHQPWTVPQSSSGSADWPPTLLRLRAEDTLTTEEPITGPMTKTGGGLTSTSTSTRPQSTTSADDPLMTMLMRLQEATMCSSTYGGDGLEMTSGSWTNVNQDESPIGHVVT